MIRRTSFLLPLISLFFLTLASAQEPTYRLEPGPTNLRELTKKVAEITGRVIVYGADFTGEVELAPASTEMTEREIWEYFLVVLSSQGWGVVASENVVRIVPYDELAVSDQPVVVMERTPSPSPGERMVTATIDLEHAQADALARQIAPLTGPEGRVVTVPGANSLVIVDTAANVERLRLVVRRLDTDDPGDSIRVVRLRRADAAELGEALQKVFADFQVEGGVVRRRAEAAGLIIVPVASTDSIVLRGRRREVDAAARLAQRLDELDDPGPMVARLRGASAEEMEPLLIDILR